MSVDQNTFSWLPLDEAVHYELWVNQYDDLRQLIGIAVVHERTLTGTDWAHDLAAGNYRAWLQAIDATGARSRWSEEVRFTIA